MTGLPELLTGVSEVGSNGVQPPAAEAGIFSEKDEIEPVVPTISLGSNVEIIWGAISIIRSISGSG